MMATSTSLGNPLSKPRDLSSRFVPSMRGPQKSAFKSIMGNPTMDMINMAGGVPHPSTFPVLRLQAEIQTRAASQAEDSNTLSLEKSQQSGSVESLDQLLQYSDGCGLDSYRRCVRDHTQRFHSPKYDGWDVIASCGNTDAIGKAISLFCGPGDSILAEKWTFPGALSYLAAAKVRPVSVDIDDQGMVPESLDRICSDWHGPHPLSVVYVIPTGHNPTGATMSLARRQDIYAIAQKHDLVVIEDDPYYFLQFPPLDDAPPESNIDTNNSYGPDGDCWDLVPSLLSLDTDGRVIRLDSFSKILAPNLRCGWITAPSYVLEKLQILNETTILQPSGLSQGVISKLLNDTWGVSGWNAHLRHLRDVYKARRNALVRLVDKHLHGLVEYTVPSAGMFLWIRVDLGDAASSDPAAMASLLDSMKKCGVMMAPETPFCSSPSDTKLGKSGYHLRAAFALVDVGTFEPAIVRLAQAISATRSGYTAPGPNSQA